MIGIPTLSVSRFGCSAQRCGLFRHRIPHREVGISALVDRMKAREEGLSSHLVGCNATQRQRMTVNASGAGGYSGHLGSCERKAVLTTTGAQAEYWMRGRRPGVSRMSQRTQRQEFLSHGKVGVFSADPRSKAPNREGSRVIGDIITFKFRAHVAATDPRHTRPAGTRVHICVSLVCGRRT